MLKKTLLTTLLSLSTIISAHVNLDLNLTIKSQSIEENATENVILDEHVPTIVTFADFDALSFSIVANIENDTAAMNVQIFQKLDNEELVAITEPIAINVPLNEPAVIVVKEAASDENDNGQLILTITPSLVE